MTETGHDPPLERPGVCPHPQHVQIVIRLEEQAIASAEMTEHVLIDVAEVAGDTDAGAIARLDHEARRIHRVVQRAAGVHIQLADRKRAVVFENDDWRFLTIDRTRVERASRQVDRYRKLACDALRAANVVVMFVSDDDRAKIGELAADLLQPLGRLARTESGIDKDAGAVALEVVRIARAARSERSDDHSLMVARYAAMSSASRRVTLRSGIAVPGLSACGCSSHRVIQISSFAKWPAM